MHFIRMTMVCGDVEVKILELLRCNVLSVIRSDS